MAVVVSVVVVVVVVIVVIAVVVVAAVGVGVVCYYCYYWPWSKELAVLEHLLALRKALGSLPWEVDLELLARWEGQARLQAAVLFYFYHSSSDCCFTAIIITIPHQVIATIVDVIADILCLCGRSVAVADRQVGSPGSQLYFVHPDISILHACIAEIISSSSRCCCGCCCFFKMLFFSICYLLLLLPMSSVLIPS